MKWNRIYCGISIALLASIGSKAALAGGGNVLPAVQDVDGYSLATAAQATAVYNTGIQAGNPATPPPPSLPFDVIVGDAVEQPNTYIYLPVFVEDNSGPPVPPAPNFPSDITNQVADAAYLDNFLLTNYGVSSLLVQVDGQNTVLDDSYITGVTTAPLLDGTPGGNEYISSSAFLSPLSVGDHTVSIGGLIGGSPAIFLSYDVTVVPEPACITLLAIGSLALLRRSHRLIQRAAT